MSFWLNFKTKLKWLKLFYFFLFNYLREEISIWREKALIKLLTVLKTNSRSWVENTKANEITKFKELGKMTL